ncbi:MAG: hypothetical protein RQ753_01935 [Desulfurivibrionaceae bacterium]|nr:hypothetical protein [Desulfobulbales bacterium]MDT8334436.1 hypothetical protein [Desulfurivibrionaceae bacterium]
MQKMDLADKNPLRIFARNSEGDPVDKRMGLLMSRPGLGKTAILVQIALDNILRGNQVLHVSIGQSLDKTRAWYNDIFKDIFDGVKLDQSKELRDKVLRNRLIMTFKEADFTRPKLEERINDLVAQDVFRPSCVIIDGYDFENGETQEVVDLKDMADVLGLQIWFSALRHREDDRLSDDGVPAPCHEVGGYFDTVVMIQPEKDQPDLSLVVVKDTTGCVKPGKVLDLDPSTYLAKEP